MPNRKVGMGLDIGLDTRPRLRRVPVAPEWAHGDLPPWRELVNYVAQAGLRAPSWFNDQPWRLRLGPQYLDLWLDANRDDSLFDWGHFNSRLACGAMLQNMILAAQARGLMVQLDLQPDSQLPHWLARLRLCSVGPQCLEAVQRLPVSADMRDMEAAIWRRCTQRVAYADTALTQAQQSLLSSDLCEFAGTEVSWLVKPSQKKLVFRANVQAELIRLGRQDLHQQLHRALRWRPEQARALRDGQALPTLAWDAKARWQVLLTRLWPVMQMSERLGWHQQMAAAESRGLLHCGAVGLLTIQDQSPLGLLQAGRAMQLVWLRATVMGLQLQPHNVLPQFHWVWAHGGGNCFRPKEQLQLQQALDGLPAPWADLCPPGQGSGVLMFRVGYGPQPKTMALRRPLRSMILNH